MDSNLKLNTAIGTELALPLAGAGSRAYAYIIDWHFRVGLVLIWMVLWFAFSYPIDFGSLADNTNSLMWLVIPASVLYLLYHPVLELLMQGNSPGKRSVGLACVDANGNAPSNGAVLLRNIMRIVDALPAFYTLGTATVILSNNHQRLGDMVADTRVVVAKEGGKQALARLDRIENARVAPEEAEVIVQLLERWSTLTKSKRRAMGTALLSRAAVTADANDKAMKRQLEALLG